MRHPNEFCFKHQTWRPAGEQCAQCAAERCADRLDAQGECLHVHSTRIDQAHDAAMSVADQLADLVAYAESLAALIRAQQAQIAALTSRLNELPMGNAPSAPAVTWIRPRP